MYHAVISSRKWRTNVNPLSLASQIWNVFEYLLLVCIP
jgi:hypothetical protein